MKHQNKLLSAKSIRMLLLSILLMLLPSAAAAQCPDDNHPHMIDLGLPSGTKWACCNVGAQKPEDYGGYFAWGETEEKKSYTEDNYLDGKGTSYDIGYDIAGTQYDAATANWGSPWVMPNLEQMEELRNNCTSEWTTENGVNGRRFTGTNGFSIFLPAAGDCGGGDLLNVGEWGFPWSSTLSESRADFGCYLTFYSSMVYSGSGSRWGGQSVRPVVAGSSIPSSNIDFADPAVKAICVANWDTNSDGELSYEEAAAVTDLGRVFEYNNAITIFNELKHFTGLTSIGMQEFFRCSNLTSISIPNSVTDIGMNAFNGCSSLTSIIIPNSVTSISYNAFNGCVSLTTITIPSSVTSIGYIAFFGCSGLTSINVEKGNPVYDSRDNCNAIINTLRNELIAGCQNTIIPNSVTSIGDGAFYGNSSLKAVIIPNSVNNIDAGAFWHCSGLASIIIEEGNAIYDSRDNCNAIIKTSNNELIVGCKNTIIPNSVTSIKDYAFYGCSNMTKMVSLIDNPFAINSNVWESINTDEIPLYVPVGTKEKYEATTGWNKFANIVEMGASSGIAIDETAFPDENFRNWVLAQDYGQDGVLTEEEINKVTEIDVDAKNISDLTGIEYFTSLTSLSCEDNQLSSLDVSKNTALTSLSCEDNQLSSLDVSNNSALERLDCDGNQLTALDVSKNTALTRLDCSRNQIKGSAMDGLIAGLPSTGGKFYAIDQDGDNEQNEVTKEQVATAKEKGWTTYYYSIEDHMWMEYEGSDPGEMVHLSCPDDNHPHIIDLGLPSGTKWSCCNVGAETPEDFGGYYAWGETEEKDYYSWSNYAHSDGSSGGCINLGSDISGTEYDVAKSKWGNNWQMPDSTQFAELIKECSATWTTIHGINGYVLEGNNGNKIFLPAAGVYGDGDQGEWGSYWTSTQSTKQVYWAIYLNFGKPYLNCSYGWYRSNGISVRPVESKQLAPIDNGETIDLGTEIDENTNLEGTVVDNVFVNISNGDGGFDPVEKCIIVNKPTDDSAIDGKDIFGEDFKDNYTGIVFKVNEGKGSIKVEAETQGNMVLKVKIGNSEPIEMELDGKLKVKFPYNVSEPTYVYIYGGMGDAGAKAMGGRAKSSADLLKIYGFEIVSDASGIDAIENGVPADAPVYNLNGQRVNTPGKGVYIKNGRKVLMK